MHSDATFRCSEHNGKCWYYENILETTVVVYTVFRFLSNYCMKALKHEIIAIVMDRIYHCVILVFR